MQTHYTVHTQNTRKMAGMENIEVHSKVATALPYTLLPTTY